jgi:phage terminase large subunit
MFDDDDIEMDEEELARYASAFRKVAQKLLEDSQRAQGEASQFEKYVNDPVGFFKEVLGIVPWESADPDQHGQGDVLRAVNDYDRVAVKSGHKVSKSCSATGLALWWAVTRPGSMTVITAPTFHQVKTILWREMANLYRPRKEGPDEAGRPRLPPFRPSLDVVFGASLPLDPSIGITFPNGSVVRGMSTAKPENMAGISSPNLFYIIDEGSGFPNEIWAAVLGNLTGGGKIFTISNPTRTDGWFFELFRTRPRKWRLFTISSENTPNAVSGERLIPGLATRETIEEYREKCGGYPACLEDPFYMVRILGKFPPQSANAVIGVNLIDDARARWDANAPPEGASLVIGVDVAREGDDVSVIQPVRGHFAYPPIAVTADMTMFGERLAGEIIRVATKMRISAEEVRVNIDGIGVGASPFDFLRMSKACEAGWLHPCSLIVGEVADNEDDFVNLRSQLWFSCAEWLKEGGKLPEHDRLPPELLCATHSYDARGRRRVLEKKKMKLALNGKSPDFADALCMATYRGPRGASWAVSYDAAPDPRHTGAGPSDAWEDVAGNSGGWG